MNWRLLLEHTQPTRININEFWSAFWLAEANHLKKRSARNGGGKEKKKKKSQRKQEKTMNQKNPGRNRKGALSVPIEFYFRFYIYINGRSDRPIFFVSAPLERVDFGLLQGDSSMKPKAWNGSSPESISIFKKLFKNPPSAEGRTQATSALTFYLRFMLVPSIKKCLWNVYSAICLQA